LTPTETDEARKWLDGLSIPAGRKILGIHPGSGKHQKWKRWDLINFIKVSNELSITQKAFAIFFLGPEDEDLYLELMKEDSNNFYLSFESESIRKTAARINCCDLFLSNDSGLRHIAASLNVKTIGVFGPTIREKNAVPDAKNKIIYSKNVQCSPCHYTSWYLSCGDLKPCLKEVSIHQVINAVADLT
jgi:heptosyltransferase-2